QQRYPRPPPQGTPHSATPASTPSPHPAHSHGSATQESRRPRDQARPSDPTPRDAGPNKARPMMLCPEARRPPNVGTAGATPIPPPCSLPRTRNPGEQTTPRPGTPQRLDVKGRVTEQGQADDAVPGSTAITERGYGRGHPHPLHRHPRNRPRRRRITEPVQEPETAFQRKAGQPPRSDHDRKGVLRHAAKSVGQHLDRVTSQKLRRLRRKQCHLR